MRIVFHWTFSCAVGEELELCGAMSTLSMERSGESAGSGSNSNTSSAQPASFPSCAGKKFSGATVRQPGGAAVSEGCGAYLQSVRQRDLVDDGPTRRVDEVRRRHHLGKRLGVHEVLGLRRQLAVDRDEI